MLCRELPMLSLAVCLPISIMYPIFGCAQSCASFSSPSCTRVHLFSTKLFCCRYLPILHRSVSLFSLSQSFQQYYRILVFLLFTVLTRLTTRWQYITALYESGELGEDVNDTQEVLEDMLNRTLTREYIDVLKVALVGSTIDPTANTSTDASMDQDDQSMDGPPQALTRAAQSAMTSEVISDLGGKLLRNQYTCTPIVMTVLR